MVNMDKLVFIVNGKPRAGKDTFAMILNRYMNVYKYSAITKVKEIATLCGWDGQKEERDRKFLHELKMLTSEYSDMAYQDVVNETVVLQTVEKIRIFLYCAQSRFKRSMVVFIQIFLTLKQPARYLLKTR